MAAYVELDIEQYADYTTTLNVTDSQGEYINLASYTASSQMRKSYFSSTATDFTVDISDSANGEVTLSMSANATVDLMPGRYLYDLVIYDSSNSSTRVIEGIVNLMPGVTRR